MSNKVGRPLNRAPGRGTFGSKLRQSRMQAGMTGIALADLLKVPKQQVWVWERGIRMPKSKETINQIAQLFDWDEMPGPQVLPRKEAPVPVTSGLRHAAEKAGYKEGEIKALERFVDGISVQEDDDFSLRRLQRSAQYVADNIQKLVEHYESTLRELHRLEQRMTGGLTIEQVEVLRDKARRWDDLQAIIERKSHV